MNRTLILAITLSSSLWIKAQESKISDTLYFNFDNSYFKRNEQFDDIYNIDEKSTGGVFELKKKDSFDGPKMDETTSFKDFVRNSKFYKEEPVRKFSACSFAFSFEEKVIYLVKKSGEHWKYIRVYPGCSIE